MTKISSWAASRSSVSVKAVAILGLVLIAGTIRPLHAQSFFVLHNFTGGRDGANPAAGLTMDRAGNLYGTASDGGPLGFGTAFKLTHSNGTFTTLYSFLGSPDGAVPAARVVFGPNGTLYGTTAGGGSNNSGTVFNLRPLPTTCRTAQCPWEETLIYQFAGGADGFGPEDGDLIFDQQGNLYGTTSEGGLPTNQGTVYELIPTGSGWMENILFVFQGGSGIHPFGGVNFDTSGNLYGTAFEGGAGFGTVYELIHSGSGWSENTIYTFQGGNDGSFPYGGLVFDQSGNAYGTTSSGGSGGGGTVFELMPSPNGWIFSTIYSFAGSGGSFSGLTIDSAGNLYGTTYFDGSHNLGSVFKLTPFGSGWMESDLHDFAGGNDGYQPISSVALDASGNLYGTASQGGTHNGGIIWEITP